MQSSRQLNVSQMDTSAGEIQGSSLHARLVNPVHEVDVSAWIDSRDILTYCKQLHAGESEGLACNC